MHTKSAKNINLRKFNKSRILQNVKIIACTSIIKFNRNQYEILQQGSKWNLFWGSECGRPGKIAIVWGKKKRLWPFVNCNIAISQPSDKALTYQIQSLAELIELLWLEQECH